MQLTPALAVAPHFHLPGGWAERLLVADGEVWRPPAESELAALVRQPATREELAACVCLFLLPAHLRSAFWQMLERQASQGDGDFVAYALEVARFLTFKLLTPPEGSAFELVARPAGGPFQAAGVWGAVNLGEGAVTVAWPGLRLRLGPGEGCRLPDGTLDVLPAEEADVLLVIRGGG